jgi:hypothetical protein
VTLSSSRMNYWCVGHFLAAVNSYLSLAFVSQVASLFAGASQSSMESSRISTQGQTLEAYFMDEG